MVCGIKYDNISRSSGEHTCKSKQRLIIILIVTGFFSGLMSGATGVYGPVVIVLAASTGLTVHEMKAWLTTTGLFETVLCLMCSPLGVSSLNTLWLYYVALQQPGPATTTTVAVLPHVAAASATAASCCW